MKINVLFTKNNCSFCIDAKRILGDADMLLLEGVTENDKGLYDPEKVLIADIESVEGLARLAWMEAKHLAELGLPLLYFDGEVYNGIKLELFLESVSDCKDYIDKCTDGECKLT